MTLCGCRTVADITRRARSPRARPDDGRLARLPPLPAMPGTTSTRIRPSPTARRRRSGERRARPRTRVGGSPSRTTTRCDGWGRGARAASGSDASDRPRRRAVRRARWSFAPRARLLGWTRPPRGPPHGAPAPARHALPPGRDDRREAPGARLRPLLRTGPEIAGDDLISARPAHRPGHGRGRDRGDGARCLRLLHLRRRACLRPQARPRSQWTRLALIATQAELRCCAASRHVAWGRLRPRRLDRGDGERAGWRGSRWIHPDQDEDQRARYRAMASDASRSDPDGRLRTATARDTTSAWVRDHPVTAGGRAPSPRWLVGSARAGSDRRSAGGGSPTGSLDRDQSGALAGAVR